METLTPTIQATPYVSYYFLHEQGQNIAGALSSCGWCGEREAKYRVTSADAISADVCWSCARDNALFLAGELDEGEGE